MPRRLSHEFMHGPTGQRNRWPRAFLLVWLKSEDSVGPLIRGLKTWPDGWGHMDEAFRQNAAKGFVAAACAYGEAHGFLCKATYVPVPDGPHWGVSN